MYSSGINRRQSAGHTCSAAGWNKSCQCRNEPNRNDTDYINAGIANDSRRVRSAPRVQLATLQARKGDSPSRKQQRLAKSQAALPKNT